MLLTCYNDESLQFSPILSIFGLHMTFQEEIRQFFEDNGLQMNSSVVPVPLVAESPADAVAQHEALEQYAGAATFVVEDRWHTQRQAVESRLLAHHRMFSQVYARNCEVRRIDKAEAESFLISSHSYGDASCKYRYGLFTLRSTGEKGHEAIAPGTLVAVSEFSSARTWKKGEQTVKSYEWVRYASLPGVRVDGGMGKMLKHFIVDVHPDDVMTYADLEWSDGEAYRKLGFELESQRAPVLFRIDPETWSRTALKSMPEDMSQKEGSLWFMNWGSLKYRLKLTDYQS